MVLTVVLTIGFNTQRMLGSRTDTMEFAKGTQLVYSISKRDSSKYDQTYYPNIATDSFNDLSEIDIESKVMARLDSAGVRNAEVSLVKGTSDNKGYQLKVNFSPLSTNELNNVKKILAMNGTLSMVVRGDDYYFTQDRGELFSSKVAELMYDGTTPYPAINIGNKDDYDKLVDEASKAYEKHKDDKKTEDDSSSSDSSTSNLIKRSIIKKADGDSDSDSSDDEAKGTVYLWCNKTVADTFDLAYGYNEKHKVASVSDKVLVELKTSNYNSDTMKWKIDKDKDGNAFNVSTARAFVTMLNSSDYGFDIEYLYSNSFSVPFGKNSDKIALISLASTLGILSVILILIYGLAGFASSLSLFTTSFFALMLFNLLGFEFSVAGLIGLIIVASLSIFMSVNYINRVKIELKKGRRIEKAHKEGFRKSVLLNLDITVITFLGSLFSFLIAKGSFKTFLGMTMVGSLVAFLITVFLNYGLMYFLTKGVSKSKVPFFGFNYSKLFAKFKTNKNNKKARKEIDLATCTVKKKSFISMITCASLPLLLLVVALPTFYSISNGTKMFNNSGDYKDSNVLNITYRMDTAKYDTLETNRNYVQYIKDIGTSSEYGKFLALEYGDEIKDEYKNLPLFYFSYDDCYTSLLEKNDSSGNKYFVKYLSIKVDRDLSKITTDGGNTIPESIYQTMLKQNVTSNDTEISIGLQTNFNSSDFAVNCFVETPIVISYYTNNLMLIVFLFSLFACIYTLFRYGINICLSQLTFSTLTASFMTALLCLTRIPYNAYTGFAMIAILILANVISVALLSKNKEVLKEKGLKGVASDSQKAETINHVFRQSLPMTISLLVSSLILVISTIFVNGSLSSTISIFTIGIIPIVLLSVFYLLPFFYILTTHISFAYFKKKYDAYKEKRKANKETVEEKNSNIKYVDDDGVHETIIVGMNEFKF